MLRVQETIALRCLRDMAGARVLDVGGGHGQLAEPLCREGYDVTVISSSVSCRRRIDHLVSAGHCAFQVGNLIDLPYPDDAFDVAISFRMLTHCRRWPTLVSELCRVASRAVVVDYPTIQSVNRLAPALFGAKKRIEGNTRHWKLFRHREVLDEFARHGYALRASKGQFFLPMVLHRAIGCRPVSAAGERVCRALGLTALWGSPVIAKMVPDASRTGQDQPRNSDGAT